MNSDVDFDLSIIPADRDDSRQAFGLFELNEKVCEISKSTSVMCYSGRAGECEEDEDSDECYNGNEWLTIGGPIEDDFDV